MEKHDALKILFQCADQYYEKLCDNTLLIISANTSGNKTFATEILFERTNFLHLTGVKFQKGKPLSPNTFYNLCRTRRLKKEDFELAPDVNRSLSSRQTKKQKILLKMVSVICRGHLFMQHPASYGNSLVRGNLDDADAVGSCSNE